MIGLNCTACHVGQLQYQGRALRLDGGPNMALINTFLQDLGVETQADARDAGAARRVLAAGARGRGPRVAPPIRTRRRTAPLWQRATRMLTQERGLLQARVDFLRAHPDAEAVARHQHRRKATAASMRSASAATSCSEHRRETACRPTRR